MKAQDNKGDKRMANGKSHDPKAKIEHPVEFDRLIGKRHQLTTWIKTVNK